MTCMACKDFDEVNEYGGVCGNRLSPAFEFPVTHMDSCSYPGAEDECDSCEYQHAEGSSLACMKPVRGAATLLAAAPAA
jgi:hypothetical protein